MKRLFDLIKGNFFGKEVFVKVKIFCVLALVIGTIAQFSIKLELARERGYINVNGTDTSNQAFVAAGYILSTIILVMLLDFIYLIRNKIFIFSVLWLYRKKKKIPNWIKEMVRKITIEDLH